MNINYIVEIRLFYDRLEMTPLPPAAIALWHGLIYLAHKAGWPRELSIPIGTLEALSGLERRSVYRTRVVLRDEGLIDFREQTGNKSSMYRLILLEAVPVCSTELSHSESERCNSDTQSVTQDGICGADLTHKPPVTDSVRCNFDTHAPICSTDLTHKPPADKEEQYNSVTQKEPCGTDLTHKDDLRYTGDTQTAVCSTDLAHKSEKDPCISIYINKDIDKGGYRGKKKNGDVDSKSPKKRNTGFDLSFIGDEVWEALVESWLEYKRSRSENYKSELSVKKFHTMLRNYSRGDPGLARQIVDKSIANNWAGIFELVPDDSKSRNPVGHVAQPARPATGQRIGQIKQPEDEERRRKLLEKFDSKK